MRVSQLLIALCAVAASLARADPLQHEFLLMPSAQAVGTFDRHAPVTQIVDEVVQADALFSLQKGPFRLFGEYLLSDHEGDLERFQLGWQVSSDTVVWLGRYHQPTSVWNHDHHHGQYLSTSITRPVIDEWEDLGGILPQHFTGMLIESSKPAFGGWRLRTAVAGGIAPQLTAHGLEPFDLLHPQSDRHSLGYQARVSLHPGELTETGFGVLVARDRLTTVGPLLPPMSGLDHVDLTLFGVFGTYTASHWKLNATAYYADALAHFTTYSDPDSFIVGYLQAEGRLPFELTAFARWEDSSRAGGAAYIRMFEEYTHSRHVIGMRWDFASRQALTVQLSDSHTLNGRFSDIRLQWSAAFF